MKIRSGFVSNSSSSSFIVALKNAKKTQTKVKIELEVDLAEYGRVISTVEELGHFFTEERYIESDELLQNENYLKCKKALEKGKIIVIGEFGDQDDSVQTMLCEYGLKGRVDSNVEVIESEGGY